jgi:hypothetical protein
MNNEVALDNVHIMGVANGKHAQGNLPNVVVVKERNTAQRIVS